VPQGESTGDVFCAGCGDFVQHGLYCDCETIDGVKIDRDALSRPHIDFANRV
jgi:hypothetical protein